MKTTLFICAGSPDNVQRCVRMNVEHVLNADELALHWVYANFHLADVLEMEVVKAAHTHSERSILRDVRDSLRHSGDTNPGYALSDEGQGDLVAPVAEVFTKRFFNREG